MARGGRNTTVVEGTEMLIILIALLTEVLDRLATNHNLTVLRD